MAEMVSSQILSKSSLEKLTLPRDVLHNKIHLFPPELSANGRADLKFLNLSVVTVSLQSVLTEPRLVLLQKGWKKIADELHLGKGDKLSIFLEDIRTWTYSIQVEKAPTIGRKAQANFGGHVAGTDESSVTGAAESAVPDTSGLQLLADCADKMMVETSNKPALRPSFDLNRSPTETEL